MLLDFSINLFLTLSCDMGGNVVQKTDVTTLYRYIHLNYQWFKFFEFTGSKEYWKRSLIINLQSVSVLIVFSILRCQSNVSKKIVGKIAVYGSSLSVASLCE